jgi:arylsulfatase A-like enzyme
MTRRELMQLGAAAAAGVALRPLWAGADRDPASDRPNILVIKAGNSICRECCHLVDILPTALSAAGGTYPKKRKGKPIETPVDGCDLSMTFRGAPLPGKRNLFFSYGGRAVVNARWKAKARGKKWLLFDMSKDLFESKDVAAEHPALLKSMIDEWTAYYEAHR